jgi:PhnB protein
MSEAASAARAVRPVPEGYHTLTPVLTIDGAAEAIDFYVRAFGARELNRAVAPDGTRIWHAELEIGDSRLMLTDEFPDMGGARGPKALGGTAGSIHIYVDDVDALVERAVRAGATLTMPLENQFWGDRYGKLTDPFGHSWGVASHVEDVSEEEQRRRVEAFQNQSG